MIKNYVSRKVRTTYDLNWKQYIIREIKNKNIFRELFKIYLGLSPPHSSAAFLARSRLHLLSRHASHTYIFLDGGSIILLYKFD